jgi:hypothetical protein
MPLNPNISLAVKGVELQDPMEKYAKLAAIQGAQSQNQLAQYQLGAAQRSEEKDIARSNALAQAGTNDEAIANALIKSGDFKGYADFTKNRQEAMKNNVDLVNSKLQQSKSFLQSLDPYSANAASKFIDWHKSQFEDPVLGPVLKNKGLSLEQRAAEVQNAINQGPEALARMIGLSQIGIEKFMQQQIIDTNGNVTVAPKYAMSQPVPAGAPQQPFGASPAGGMPAGIPGQTPPTRQAGANALALPAPGGGGVMPSGQPYAVPGVGMVYPKSLSRVQQLQEDRAQQQLGMERERLDLSREESMRKRAEVPSEIRKELTSIDQQRSVIDGALKAVKDTPNAFSFARGAVAGVLPYGESLAGRTETPEQTQARAYVFNNVSRVINERAGAAQSAQEMQRLRSFLPADTDNAEQITNKLKGFQTYLQDLEKGTIKAVPPAAKEFLEKTRGAPAAGAAPVAEPTAAPKRREIAPGVFVTERP